MSRQWKLVTYNLSASPCWVCFLLVLKSWEIEHNNTTSKADLEDAGKQFQRSRPANLRPLLRALQHELNLGEINFVHILKFRGEHHNGSKSRILMMRMRQRLRDAILNRLRPVWVVCRRHVDKPGARDVELLEEVLPECCRQVFFSGRRRRISLPMYSVGVCLVRLPTTLPSCTPSS